ncbi:MAG: hypothetical protein ACKVVT_08435 [Dehalococcoidia bacterium]
MSTATEDRDEASPPPPPAHNQEIGSLLRCKRCNLNYVPNKSTSALRLTYCSFFCELGDLGFSMAGLEHMQRRPEETAASPA